jgi:hypothetical protein
MAQWWNGLSTYGQIAFGLAVSATFVMLVFLVLMLFGIEDGNSFDQVGDDPSDGADTFNDEPIGELGGLRIVTLRGVLAFLSIGGWAAFIFEGITGPIWSSLIGVVFGTIAAVLLAYAMRASLKLESEGNLNYENAVGLTATVYLSIPKNHTGKGKVTLVIQERFIDTDAVTNDGEDIPNKALVEVVGVENLTTLVVKIKK